MAAVRANSAMISAMSCAEGPMRSSAGSAWTSSNRRHRSIDETRNSRWWAAEWNWVGSRRSAAVLAVTDEPRIHTPSGSRAKQEAKPKLPDRAESIEVVKQWDETNRS